jgi:hypothetical protein
MTRGAKSGAEVAELVAYEEKMMGELPRGLHREHILRVMPHYKKTLGDEGARRVHAAMVAKLKGGSR